MRVGESTGSLKTVLVATLLAMTTSPSALASASSVEMKQAAERALAGRAGAIVVLDVRSGETLANVFSGMADLPYPPGSTSKVVTAHAGLQTGAIHSETTWTCRNAMRIGGKTFHCTVPGGHGPLKLDEAISLSCNIWFYQAARKTGKAAIYRSWKQLGAQPVIDPNWNGPVERLGVGQEGIRVSVMDMAKAARTLALKKDSPSSPCRDISRGMRLVATAGTAKSLGAAGFDVAGKTGSPAHVLDPEKRHGWFMGYFPASRPEIAFAVFCLEGSSFESAVPVTQSLLTQYRRKAGGQSPHRRNPRIY